MIRWLAMAGLCVAAAVQAEEPWRAVRRDGALSVESRPAGAGGYLEFRVVTHSAAPPLALADAVWRWNAQGVEGRMVEQRLVLSEAPREKLVWQLLHPPVVERREALVRFRRDDASDAVHIAYESEAGPTPLGPRAPPAVRVTVRGSWRFEVEGAGSTRVEHRCLSDPGGGLPSWLVKGAQEDMAVALVREAVQRAEGR